MPAQGARVAHAQVAAVEGVLHREEARPFPGRQLRHPDPVLAGELRQVRSGKLDESRLLPSAEKRARDLVKKLAATAAKVVTTWSFSS